MNNKFDNTKLVLILLLFVMITISVIIAKEIHSIKGLGNWNKKNTWIGNEIPQKEDDVVINDSVYVSGVWHCDSLTIMPGGYLEIKENAELHTYTIKMVNSEDEPSVLLNMGIITTEVRSPCDYNKGKKK